jgi:predicted Rossmann fold flavoprotein
VLDALLRRLNELNVTLLCEHKIKAMLIKDEQFLLQGDHFNFKCKNVVLATGGLSYPTTGSDGTGYRLAQSFGHPLIDTTPALTPLTSNDQSLKSLSGITLNVALTLLVDGQKKITCSDSFLFTHLGFSGPAALDISRHFLRAQGKKEIRVNFIPQYDESSFLQYLRQLTEKQPRKVLRSILADLLPQRLAELILKKAGINLTLTLDGLTKSSRQELIELCVRHPLHITGAVGYAKAEATAGGVDFSEINPKILESKLMPGLFFAGEILDVDGRIGGFNFQWAWASGYTVAQAIIQRMRKEV